MSRDDNKIAEEENSIMSMLKLGPFPSLSDAKGSGDNEYKEEMLVWDVKVKSKLTQMFISYDSDHIKSIAFQYIEDDKLTLSPIYGRQILDGPNFETVMFMDGEHITKVGGFHAEKMHSNGMIRNHRLKSLTIETNENTYGPFGKSTAYIHEPKFQVSLGQDQFGGFHGISSPYFLASIGVYLKPIQDLGAFSMKSVLPID